MERVITYNFEGQVRQTVAIIHTTDSLEVEMVKQMLIIKMCAAHRGNNQAYTWLTDNYPEMINKDFKME